MKRCPQCEFIYEDDQSLCDMDGALLVFDARTLPNLHALATVDVPVAPRPYWRHRTFPAMAALILATVLSLVYFVSTQRTAPVSAPISQTPLSNAATTAAPSNDSAAPTSDANQTPPSSSPPEANSASVTGKDDSTAAKDENKSAPAKTNSKPTNTPVAAAKQPAAKTTTTQSKAEEPKKDDSKVGSILKKTGRLLKKPFKF
ncbi:MAG TPA: hypothetical protein VGK82_02885 [Pyrinomonadaceae bacterium]